MDARMRDISKRVRWMWKNTGGSFLPYALSREAGGGYVGLSRDGSVGADWLVPRFLAFREDVTGNFRHLPPLDVKAAAVAEQRSPHAVVHADDDSEASRSVVVPFPDIRDPAQQHRETEPDHTLIEPLRAGPQPQPTSLVHRKVDINRQVLV